jgi:NADH:ubiquinone oxidoreductase subunit E
MGTACYVRSSEILLEQFSEKLNVKVGETTEDMMFTLKSVRCIGCCGLAPVSMIGENVYGKLQTKSIPEIIKKIKKEEMQNAQAHN